MGLLDNFMPSVVKNTLTLLGASAKLKRQSAPSYNPRTGTTARAALSSQDVKISPPERYRIEGDRWSADFRCTVGAFDILSVAVAPDPQTDVLVVAGTTFKITQVRPQYSGDSICAYELTVQT